MNLDELLKQLGLKPDDYDSDEAKYKAIAGAAKADPAAGDDGDDDTKRVSKAKLTRLEGERDEARKQLEKLTGELDALKKAADGEKGDLQAELDRIKAEAEAAAKESDTRLAGAEKAHAIETALLQAGVKPSALKGALAYVDSEAATFDGGKLGGVDTDGLKKEHPYLFGEVKTGGTGAPPAAGGNGGSDNMREAFNAQMKG